MHCVVSAGPTWEPLDEVRRLTNFSTGRLGTELANFLTMKGHATTLLIGEQSSWRGERRVQRVMSFGTGPDLATQLRKLADEPVDAVFHAAAVSDFRFGKVWSRSGDGSLIEVEGGKLSTRTGVLLSELIPTEKILGQLRDWFRGALIVGWKYEADGDRSSAIAAARDQLRACRNDACVANGPAYGEGYGLVKRAGSSGHWPDRDRLFKTLEKLLRR